MISRIKGALNHYRYDSGRGAARSNWNSVPSSNFIVAKSPRAIPCLPANALHAVAPHWNAIELRSDRAEQLLAFERLLLASDHVLQLICAIGQFIVSNNQREPRAHLVGDLQCPLQLPIRRALDRNSRGAQFRGQRSRRAISAASPIGRQKHVDFRTYSPGCASSTLITRRSSPIENPIPGAATFDPSDSASPSYRPPPSTEFCAPSAPCVISNVVRM